MLRMQGADYGLFMKDAMLPLVAAVGASAQLKRRRVGR